MGKQLTLFEEIQSTKKTIWERYFEKWGCWPNYYPGENLEKSHYEKNIKNHKN
jgi:hypothetical protein